MKKFIPILLLLCLLFACERQPDELGPDISRDASAISAAFNAAYKAGSTEALKRILENWQQENPPQRLENLQDPVCRDIHQIYRDFFTPFKLNRIGNSEWGDGLYQDVEYVIVQHQVFYDFSLGSAVFNQLELDTLHDFRPELSFEEAGVLYLTPNYHQAIYDFLGTDFRPLGSDGIMNPAYAVKDVAQRHAFLNRMLHIVYGHWGGYWHIETHPEVTYIRFNAERTRARVYFRLIYQGGEAEYAKEGANWTMTSSRLTWIE